MEMLKAMAYAGFGLLSYKISGVFFHSPFIPILIGVLTITLLLLLIDIIPNKDSK